MIKNKNNEYKNKLKEKLRELFQFDSAELDFGIYRIMNYKRKEIIKEATIKSASSIILVHNHPSGDTEPSADDIKLTNKIIDACNFVGIKVLDHIIIGKNREDYYSFANAGLIK